jgi:hypothetical protein
MRRPSKPPGCGNSEINARAPVGPYTRPMPRFHIRLRSSGAQKDLAMLGRANLEARGAPENHIDVFVEADDPETARQQVSQALGRDRDDYGFVQTDRASD